MSTEVWFGLTREQVLDFEPEEIAVYLLAELNAISGQRQRAQPNLHNFIGATMNPRDEAKQAVAEAWSYLVREGLIAPIEGNNYFVTRRGRKIRTPEEFARFRGTRLPHDLLHEAIVQRVDSSYLRGEFDIAVFVAFKEVEIQVRAAAGLTSADRGVALMRKAFDDKHGPLRDQDPDTTDAERQALAHLFAGAFGYFRNPSGHRDVGLVSPAEALEIIGLASHLLRIVDRRKADRPPV